MPPTLVSEDRGPHLGAQQASWALVGRANALLSSPAPPVWEGPSRLPLLISWASLLCPKGPTRPGGGLRGQGTVLGAQQALQPEWARRSPSASLLLFPESPSRLPLLISPASGAPSLSGLHFSPLSPPTSYLFTLEFLPSPWVSEFSTSGRQAP